MIKVAIAGVGGYTGEELLKILSRHPGVEISKLFDLGTLVSKPISEIYPHISLNKKIYCEELDITTAFNYYDIIFLALPHGESAEIAKQTIKNGKKVIDLSADFRLKDANIYEKWYKIKHRYPELLESAVYGIPELYPGSIKKAPLIANPGCYPTTVILGIAPLLKNFANKLDLSSIIIDSKSGVSGGGRNFAKTYFEKEHPNLKPYNIAGVHRHIPEIEQELSRLINHKTTITVSFTPHIIPVERGMLSAIYINTKNNFNFEQIYKSYTDFYKEKPFIKVYDNDKLPSIKDVVETNFCAIGLRFDERTNKLIIITAIDNLIKGASGQAVQNMNLMFGFEETEGLL